jgi:hypothetical protein
MKAVIIHADGRRIDLSATVDPDTYAELENTRSPRHRPVLWCGGCGGGIYIKHGIVRKDELFGCHHHAGTCTETLVIRKSTMSDEHKREAEYHARAAERAGHVADFEVVTAGHTRVDVVVDGRVGFEIQRSAISKAAAVDRTARSVRAGLGTVAWFTDRSTAPPWNGHVPGYRTLVPVSAWQALPQPGTVGAAGLQAVEAVRCGTRRPCPHRRRPCNLFIPWLAAWIGLHVDDVVTGLAENRIRPVRVDKYVQLMSTDSIACTRNSLASGSATIPGRLRPHFRHQAAWNAPCLLHACHQAHRPPCMPCSKPNSATPDRKARPTYNQPLCRQRLRGCASAAVSSHAALTRSRYARNATTRLTSSSPGGGHEARPHPAIGQVDQLIEMIR